MDALYQAVEELRQGGSRIFQLCTQVDLVEGCGIDLDDPESPVLGDMELVGSMWDESLQGIPCRECGGLEHEAEMVVCDRCEGCWHPGCGDDGGRNTPHEGPCYYPTCWGYIVHHGF